MATGVAILRIFYDILHVLIDDSAVSVPSVAV